MVVFHPVKNHKLLIDSVARVLADNTNIQVVMVGRGIDYHNQELIDTISRTGYPNAFSLIGEVDNPSDYFSIADVFILHSVSEGFPNALGRQWHILFLVYQQMLVMRPICYPILAGSVMWTRRKY